MKTYNVGLIGFGFIGKVHAYGYLNLPLFYDPVPLQARITHVCTSRPETAEAGRRQLGAEVAVTDSRAITENPAIDIVHICTPNHLHAGELLSAMAHQKHIYCDKPLVATAAEADQVRAALPAYHGVAQMTFHNRFFPPVLRARQLIAEGALGQLLQFRSQYYHSGNADPETPLKWKLSAAAGGGVIADLASHAVDLVHHLLGDLSDGSAVTQIAYPDRPADDRPGVRVPVDAEDSVVAMVRAVNGALGVIEASKLATGTEDELRFEAHGSRGALRLNIMDPHYLDVYDLTAPDQPLGGRRGWLRVECGQRFPRPAARFPSPKSTAGWLRAHLACLAQFLGAVAEERPVEPDLRQGIFVQYLLDRIRHSASTGQWVRLPRRGEI
jgi:predicted dehydrogenase